MFKKLKTIIVLFVASLCIIFTPDVSVNAQEVQSSKVGDPLFIYFEGCGGKVEAKLEDLMKQCEKDTYLLAWIENPRDLEFGGAGDNIYVKIEGGSSADQYYKIPYSIFSKACRQSGNGDAQIINTAGEGYYISDDCKEGDNINNMRVRNKNDFINIIRASYESQSQTPTINAEDGVASDTQNAVSATNTDQNDIFAVVMGVLAGFLLLLVWLIGTVLIFVVRLLASSALFLIRFNPASDYIFPSLEPIWQVVVNLANLGILAGFIFMGVGLILGLSSFKGGQKITGFLTGLVFMAVLANFSLTISATVVNLTQTAGDLFVAAVVIPADKPEGVQISPVFNPNDQVGRQNIGNANNIFVESIFGNFEDISGIRKQASGFGESIDKIIEGMGSAETSISNLILEIFMIAAMCLLLLVFWGAFKVAIFRLAWLIILMVTSPIALVSFFTPIPALQAAGKQWSNKFFGVAPLYPIFIIGLYFASYIAATFNSLTPSDVASGGIGSAVSNIISGIFSGNAGTAIGGALGEATVSFVLLIIGPAISIAILYELMKYLNNAFQDHAAAIVDGGRQLVTSAKNFVGNSVRGIGKVASTTGKAANNSLKFTGAGVGAIFGGAKGTFRKDGEGLLRGVRSGAKSGSEDWNAGKRLKEWWKRDTVFGADQKEKNKEIAEKDSDIALRKAGKHELADRLYPSSAYNGMTQADIERKQKKGENLYAQNKYTSDEQMYKKQGRTLSPQGNFARLDRLEEDLKDKNFDYSRLNDVDKHQIDSILETAKTDKSLARRLNSSPKLAEFFAKNAPKMASNMGDPDKVMGMLTANPSVGLRVEDEGVFKDKNVKDAVMQSIYDDPVGFDNIAFEKDLETAATIKDGRSTEGYLKWKKDANVNKVFVPRAPKKLTADELKQKTPIERAEYEKAQAEYQKIKAEYSSKKNEKGDWLDKNAGEIGKLAAEKAGKGKAVTQEHIKEAANEYIKNDKEFATAYSTEYSNKVKADIAASDSEIAFTIENQVNNAKSKTQLERENNATMVEELKASNEAALGRIEAQQKANQKQSAGYGDELPSYDVNSDDYTNSNNFNI